MKVSPFLVNRAPPKRMGEYARCLDTLYKSCQRLSMELEVLTDGSLSCPYEMRIQASASDLMVSILEAQMGAVAQQDGPLALCGVDCLFLDRPDRGLAGVDLMVTTHPFKDCHLNTGLILSAGPQTRVVWQRALEYLAFRADEGIRWGDDQKALWYALGGLPVADERQVVRRLGLTIAVEPCRYWNWAPENLNDDAGLPVMVHFRGPRKSWMPAWWSRHGG